MGLQLLGKQVRISPVVRVISGLTGVLGFAAIAFEASQEGGFQLNAMLLTSFFAGFVFLYVSFFGKYPWEKSNADDTDE
jgi:hypothetical protein